MKIAIAKETHTLEKRCAASPDSVKKFVALGAKVAIEKGAGEGAGFSDDQFRDAGATISTSAKTAFDKADIILTVNALDEENLSLAPKGVHLVGMLSPFEDAKYKDAGLHAFAMEKLPRISRAQSMDVLSSQANLAGYRAVIEAVQYGGKVIPMMMTAAGTVPPAKILVLGAGVAGLQAIATAKRLGGVVSAFDVRPAVKEQVESLGGKFIEVPAEEADGEDSGGYAKEMSEEYKQKQAALIAETAKSQDIIISTALIPGREAPELITAEMLSDMKDGAVVVDMAAIAGGNCKSTKLDEVTEVSGVHLIGYSNLPSRCAKDSAPLYARNLYTFVSTLMVQDGAVNVQWDDELIAGTCITAEPKEASDE